VRFWDSSAIVPLVAGEPSTASLVAEFGRDPEMLVWWATEVECVSALARREREGGIDGPAMSASLKRLSALAASWRQIEPVLPIRQTAVRLVRVHPLRAGDALQLAAAIVAAEGQPASLSFVTLDDRLAQVAEREGFPVVTA
jgi:predicted nucleic acid-binding protein